MKPESSPSEGAISAEESSRSEGAISEEDVSRSEDDVATSSIDVVPPHRSSSRLVDSSLKVQVRAAVMQYKKLLHTLHKDIPIRLTKRKKDGSIILVSKANAIHKIQQALTPASMKQALAGPDADK